jgi:hypothetical protein
VSGVEKVEIEAIFDEANHSSTIKNSVYLEITPTQDDGVATALDTWWERRRAGLESAEAAWQRR